MKFTPGDSIDDDGTIEFEGATAGAWLTVPLGPGRPVASVRMTVTDEGLVIDVYPLDGEDDGPVGSTYVFDGELTND